MSGAAAPDQPVTGSSPAADQIGADQGAVVLQVEALRAGYVAGMPVVNDVSLHVRIGEIVALLGPNGAGKSTVVKAVAGVAPRFGGRVVCAGTDISGRAAWRIARAGIGYVPQRGNTFDELTVQENLALGRNALHGRPGAATVEVLALFPELAMLRQSRVGTLSGGTRQMVAVGRALLGGPVVLLLDEPSAGLAPHTVRQLFSALAALKSRVPVLLVEQNVRAALAIADRVLLLADGRVRLETTPSDLLADPALAQAFLGPAVVA